MTEESPAPAPRPDEPVTASAPLSPQAKSKSASLVWLLITGLFMIAAVVAWLVTVIKAFSESSDVDDIANNSFLDASAVQISQVADQALLRVLPLLVLSLALTAAALFAAAIWAVTSLARPRLA